VRQYQAATGAADALLALSPRRVLTDASIVPWAQVRSQGRGLIQERPGSRTLWKGSGGDRRPPRRPAIVTSNITQLCFTLALHEAARAAAAARAAGGAADGLQREAQQERAITVACCSVVSLFRQSLPSRFQITSHSLTAPKYVLEAQSSVNCQRDNS
jgi:hypothetical protein